jgi:hypothetical protein
MYNCTTLGTSACVWFGTVRSYGPLEGPAEAIGRKPVHETTGSAG